MKKLFALMIAVTTVTVGFSQQGYPNNRGNDNNRYTVSHQQNGGGYNQRDDHTTSGNNDRRFNDRRVNDRQRQQEIDRMNRDYDRRVNEYRNDRRLSQRDRDRRIYEVEQERSSRVGNFGKGLAVGAVAGVLLGVILAH